MRGRRVPKSGLCPDAERPACAGPSTRGGEHERECDGADPLEDASLHDLMIVPAATPGSSSKLRTLCDDVAVRLGAVAREPLVPIESTEALRDFMGPNMEELLLPAGFAVITLRIFQHSARDWTRRFGARDPRLAQRGGGQPGRMAGGARAGVAGGLDGRGRRARRHGAQLGQQVRAGTADYAAAGEDVE